MKCLCFQAVIFIASRCLEAATGAFELTKCIAVCRRAVVMQLRNRFVGDSGNDDRPSKRRRTDSETVQFQSRSTTLTARQLTDASSFAPIERKITRRAAGRGRKSATLPDETAIPWPTGLFAHLPYEASMEAGSYPVSKTRTVG